METEDRIEKLFEELNAFAELLPVKETREYYKEVIIQLINIYDFEVIDHKEFLEDLMCLRMEMRNLIPGGFRYS